MKNSGVTAFIKTEESISAVDSLHVSFLNEFLPEYQQKGSVGGWEDDPGYHVDPVSAGPNWLLTKFLFGCRFDVSFPAITHLSVFI